MCRDRDALSSIKERIIHSGNGECRRCLAGWYRDRGGHCGFARIVAGK